MVFFGQYMKPVELSSSQLQALAQYLNVPKEKEAKLFTSFQRSPYRLLKRARFDLPPNIKSNNWLMLMLKQKLQVELSEEESQWLQLIRFFQIDDFTAVHQGLLLLEGMYSLEEIAEFFDINLADLFFQDQPLCVSGAVSSRVYKSMSWLQADRKLAGYIFLWFLALIFAENPKKIEFRDGRFQFLPEATSHTEQFLRKKCIFR